MNFYSRLEEAMLVAGKVPAGTRIKVVVFGDYKDDAEPMKESAFFNLPEEVLFRTNLEPNKHCSRCKTRKMPLDELEKMLAAEYGNKLKPIKKDRP